MTSCTTFDCMTQRIIVELKDGREKKNMTMKQAGGEGKGHRSKSFFQRSYSLINLHKAPPSQIEIHIVDYNDKDQKSDVLFKVDKKSVVAKVSYLFLLKIEERECFIEKGKPKALQLLGMYKIYFKVQT